MDGRLKLVAKLPARPEIRVSEINPFNLSLQAWACTVVQTPLPHDDKDIILIRE